MLNNTVTWVQSLIEESHTLEGFEKVWERIGSNCFAHDAAVLSLIIYLNSDWDGIDKFIDGEIQRLKLHDFLNTMKVTKTPKVISRISASTSPDDAALITIGVFRLFENKADKKVFVKHLVLKDDVSWYALSQKLIYKNIK